MLAACIVGYLPVQMLIVTGVIFTAAFVLLVPVVLGLLAWLVATVLYPLLGTEGRIAHRQILRRRVRTTLTIGILYIAVSTAISLGTNILDNVEDIHTWMDKTLKGDYFVRLMNQDVASGQAAKMPEALVNDIRAIEGVANVDSIRQIPPIGPLGRRRRRQAASDRLRPRFHRQGQPAAGHQGRATRRRSANAWPKAKSCSATSWRTSIGVKVGEEITLETREGPKQLRVAATATAYIVGGKVVYMEGADRPPAVERRRRRLLHRQHAARGAGRRRAQSSSALRSQRA